MSMGSARATVGQPGLAVPLHGLDHACQDARYPALAGPWVVACGPEGLVDRALSLETGVELRLPAQAAAPGLAEGLLLLVGSPAGGIRLEPGGATLLDLPQVRTRTLAPPATDGTRGAVLAEGSVSAWPLTERTRVTHPARPVGWYPPALAGQVLAWVQDGGADGEDVWALGLEGEDAAPRPLAGGPGHQRHVVGSGDFLAWVEPGAVVIHDTRTGQERRLPVETGFSAPPTLWGEVLCWEERPAPGPEGERDGVDIRCSDGLDAAGPGHQRWPSRFGPWLLYREGDQPWLRTAEQPPATTDAPSAAGSAP